jgi:hypothetical protein
MSSKLEGKMKKAIILLFFIYNISIFSEGTNFYKDVKVDNWAYRAVKNLVENGIFDIEKEEFLGNENIDRYEFAFYLSRMLNKIDETKASRSDLFIIENIVYEFSKELNSFAFNSEEYIKKISNLEEKVDKLEKNSVKIQESLLDINERLKSLEQNSGTNQNYILENSIYNDKLKYLQNFNLYLASGISYKQNSKIEEDRYKGNYTLGLGITDENFELIIESETSDETKKDGELVVKGQIATRIDFMGGSTLSYHTKGYEKYYKSYFNNVIFDNHSSYQYNKLSDTTTSYSSLKKTVGDNSRVAYYDLSNETIDYELDEFDSYGLSFLNKNFVILVEKVRTDRATDEKEGIINPSGNIAYSDTFVFFGQTSQKYIDATAMINGNIGNRDFEIVGKYPGDFYDLAGGFTISQRVSSEEVQNYSGYKNLFLFDARINFGDTRDIEFGTELKNSNYGNNLYQSYYFSFKYLLGDTGVIKYKGENINAKDQNNFINHYFLVNFNSGRLKTYTGYNIISANKNAIVNDDSIVETNYVYNGLYSRIKNYDEFLIKAEYQFNKKLIGKIGYYLKSLKDSIVTEENATTFQFIYNFAENIKIFAKYMENDGEDINDRQLDINDDMLDIDFDETTGVIRKAEEGKVEIGVEIKF